MSNTPLIGTPGLQLIGIVGHAGAGKDTVAEYIRTRYQNTYIESFASPLKRAACHAFGIPLRHFNESDLKEEINGYWNISPRKIVQFMGTEIFRNTINQLVPEIGSDFWILRHCGRMDGELILNEDNSDGEYLTGDTVLVPDVRFQNEYDYIIANGGVVIHITRPGKEGAVGIANHASEQLNSLNVWNTSRNWIINNSGTLDELATQIRHTVQSIQDSTNFKLVLEANAISINDL